MVPGTDNEESLQTNYELHGKPQLSPKNEPHNLKKTHIYYHYFLKLRLVQKCSYLKHDSESENNSISHNYTILRFILV